MPHHLMLTVMTGLFVPKLHKDAENKYLLQTRVKDSY